MRRFENRRYTRHAEQREISRGSGHWSIAYIYNCWFYLAAVLYAFVGLGNAGISVCKRLSAAARIECAIYLMGLGGKLIKKCADIRLGGNGSSAVWCCVFGGVLIGIKHRMLRYSEVFK